MRLLTRRRFLLQTGAAVGGWVMAPRDSLMVAADLDRVASEPKPPLPELKVPDFYTQYLNAAGYPIVGSDKASGYALKEAAYLVNLMLAKRPDVRAAMVKSGSRLNSSGPIAWRRRAPKSGNGPGLEATRRGMARLRRRRSRRSESNSHFGFRPPEASAPCGAIPRFGVPALAGESSAP